MNEAQNMRCFSKGHAAQGRLLCERCVAECERREWRQDSYFRYIFYPKGSTDDKGPRVFCGNPRGSPPIGMPIVWDRWPLPTFDDFMAMLDLIEESRKGVAK